MEGEGKSEHMEGHGVIRREIEGRELAVGSACYGDLVRLQQNVILLGFGHYGIAEIVIRAGCGQSDARAALHGEVVQIFLQLALGQFAGNDLPARADGENESGEC